MTQTRPDLLKYVNELREYDHAFLAPAGAQYFAEAFGFTAKTYTVEASPNEPKGLTLHNGAKQAEGIAADRLAIDICCHVGVEYESKFGRGSQLRACCDALEQWLRYQAVKVDTSWRIQVDGSELVGWYMTERQAQAGIAKRIRETLS
jgi:hypothetical protein